MDASVLDLVVCVATWAMPLAILGLLCMFGDRALDTASVRRSAEGNVFASIMVGSAVRAKPSPQAQDRALLKTPNPHLRPLAVRAVDSQREAAA